MEQERAKDRLKNTSGLALNPQTSSPASFPSAERWRKAEAQTLAPRSDFA